MNGYAKFCLHTAGETRGNKNENNSVVTKKRKTVESCVLHKVLPSFHDTSSVQKIPYRALGDTDIAVSPLSIGGSGFGNVYGDINQDAATKTLHSALRMGLNYIDTAPWYGQGKSESFLGRALAGVPRDAYSIATKVGRYEPEFAKMFDFSASRVQRSIEESLERLRLPYVDVLQIHDVEFAPSIDIIINETLPMLQKLKEQGKCRYIGITGYPIASLKEVVLKSRVKIDTVLSYCHLTLNDSTLLDELDFFDEHNLPIINASPIGMGLLCNAGAPAWHPASAEIKETCQRAIQYCQSQDVDITKLAIYHSICHEQVPTTLTSIYSQSILESNLDTLQNGLTDKEHTVREHILREFFEPLKVKTWEGVEIANYQRELKQSNN